MNDLILYTRPGCRLCDEALATLDTLAGERRVEVCDISGDLGLLSSYGARIPVFKRLSDGAELGWPFSREQLEDFVR